MYLADTKDWGKRVQVQHKIDLVRVSLGNQDIRDYPGMKGKVEGYEHAQGKVYDQKEQKTLSFHLPP